ncbi:hypothetical protein J8TS2_08800 [Lederbergia ruris]|uniref:Uncharacterized protein n=1 Tax=Lederbergia ruris TaxID=217495 RepID=A0ABQ4KGH0_9BACI|nr:hypothetical protein J8TS2_08800 [Lederbergia ruris]
MFNGYTKNVYPYSKINSINSQYYLLINYKKEASNTKFPADFAKNGAICEVQKGKSLGDASYSRLVPSSY